jgi:hypothetical protein
MRLSAPKKWVWYVSLFLGLIALLFQVVKVPVITDRSFWIVAIGWLLLILATLLKGF